MWVLLTNWRSILSNRKPPFRPTRFLGITTITRNFEEPAVVEKFRNQSDMINVHFDIIYRWKIWNGIRKEGEGIEGGRERRSASVSNSTTRRTRSLIDIVYRFDRSPRPPAQTHESRPRSTVAKFVKGFDRFHLSRDATRQRRRAR